MKEVPRDKVSTTKQASSKKQNHKLVGKYIKHKCNHSWLNAKVVRSIGTEVCDDSDFEVEYEGFNGLYNKKLIADLKNNLIVVVGSVSAIDKRKHLLNMGEESEECDDGPKGAEMKRGRGKGQQKGQAKKRGKGKKESEKRQDEELVRRSGRKRKLVDYTKMSGDDHDTDNATDNVDDSTEGSSGRSTFFGEYIGHKWTVSDDSGWLLKSGMSRNQLKPVLPT